MPLFLSFKLFLIINLLLIGVQFAHIQINTQCSIRQVPPSVHVTHSPPSPPSSPSITPSLFPRVRSLYVLSLWYFPHISSPFPYIPFHSYLYSPSEWEHTMFVLLQLTYFTQHDTIQFHPRWIKWWVFVVSNGWGIFYFIHKPNLLYTFILQ